jgi:hypothetical protein
MHPRTAEKQGFGGIGVENSEQNLNYGAVEVDCGVSR